MSIAARYSLVDRGGPSFRMGDADHFHMTAENPSLGGDLFPEPD